MNVSSVSPDLSHTHRQLLDITENIDINAKLFLHVFVRNYGRLLLVLVFIFNTFIYLHRLKSEF